MQFLDDLSYKKHATQSRMYHWLHGAIYAVDRNKTCMRADPIGNGSPDKNMWWKVEFAVLTYCLKPTINMVCVFVNDVK